MRTLHLSFKTGNRKKKWNFNQQKKEEIKNGQQGYPRLLRTRLRLFISILIIPRIGVHYCELPFQICLWSWGILFSIFYITTWYHTGEDKITWRVELTLHSPTTTKTLKNHNTNKNLYKRSDQAGFKAVAVCHTTDFGRDADLPLYSILDGDCIRLMQVEPRATTAVWQGLRAVEVGPTRGRLCCREIRRSLHLRRTSRNAIIVHATLLPYDIELYDA